MWIRKERIKNLEKRIADLEESQLKSAKMVKEYITDSETECEKLNQAIRELPLKLKELLSQYGVNE